MDGTDLVTGATGYSGSYVAERLIHKGRQVRTLTREPSDVPDPIEAFRYRFDVPDEMLDAFRGVDTFYNTYWVRFGRVSFTHDDAVRNSLALITAAARAGVRRIVHVSIMNPDIHSPYSYHRGKALVEAAVQGSGLQYAIVRPSVLFGGGDILLNNVAWLLRHLHVFAVPGDGSYQIRPTHVEDLADLMVALGHSEDPVVRNAGGPETFAFGDLVRLIGEAAGARALVLNLPKAVVTPMISIVNRITGDVTLHRAELDALMAGLATCDGEPAGSRRLTDFLSEQGRGFGAEYASEMERNYSVPTPSRAQVACSAGSAS
jgi:NADH dehydrogenase